MGQQELPVAPAPISMSCWPSYLQPRHTLPTVPWSLWLGRESRRWPRHTVYERPEPWPPLDPHSPGFSPERAELVPTHTCTHTHTHTYPQVLCGFFSLGRSSHSMDVHWGPRRQPAVTSPSQQHRPPPPALDGQEGKGLHPGELRALTSQA